MREHWPQVHVMLAAEQPQRRVMRLQGCGEQQAGHVARRIMIGTALRARSNVLEASA